MPSTTVHLPTEILKSIDTVARRRGISRNKFVIQACKEAVSRDAGEWPEGFFNLQLSSRDEDLLNEACNELENRVLSRRKNRGALLL